MAEIGTQERPYLPASLAAWLSSCDWVLANGLEEEVMCGHKTQRSRRPSNSTCINSANEYVCGHARLYEKGCSALSSLDGSGDPMRELQGAQCPSPCLENTTEGCPTTGHWDRNKEQTPVVLSCSNFKASPWPRHSLAHLN